MVEAYYSTRTPLGHKSSVSNPNVFPSLLQLTRQSYRRSSLPYAKLALHLEILRANSDLEGDKGNSRQLCFPPFHSEMLTQVWADAAQNMGRVKIIIAEGIHNGQATAGFQKLRNIVAFSFQHAPLRESNRGFSSLLKYCADHDADILENCGIAWPNPGMWWQGQPQFSGVSSPAKDVADREAHAHSPRRREASMKMARAAQLESSMAPPPMPSNLRAQDAFQNRRTYNRDPFWAQYGQRDDPFIGSAGSNSFCNKMTSRNTSSSGDVSMPDTSRYGSSNTDVPIHDYQQSLSPTSSYRSYAMVDASRLHSQAASRSVSGYPISVLKEHRLGVTLQGQEDNSHFNDDYTSMSPRVASGISAPSNTRVSSAANTPPGPHQDGSSAVSRAASYTGHARSVPVTTNDPPPPYVRVPSNLAKPQSEARKSSSNVLVHEDTGEQAEPPIAKKPRGRPKGRKEGRTSEVGLEHPSDEIRRRTSSGSTTNNNKENSHAGSGGSSNGKRKRVTSNDYPEGVMLRSTSYLDIPDSNFTSPTRKVSKHSPRQDLSPNKLEFEDDLTSEGVVTRIRTPLSELETAV